MRCFDVVFNGDVFKNNLYMPCFVFECIVVLRKSQFSISIKARVNMHLNRQLSAKNSAKELTESVTISGVR